MHLLKKLIIIKDYSLLLLLDYLDKHLKAWRPYSDLQARSMPWTISADQARLAWWPDLAESGSLDFCDNARGRATGVPPYCWINTLPVLRCRVIKAKKGRHCLILRCDGSISGRVRLAEGGWVGKVQRGVFYFRESITPSTLRGGYTRVRMDLSWV